LSTSSALPLSFDNCSLQAAAAVVELHGTDANKVAFMLISRQHQDSVLL
jgi:hypothetical protein